MKKTIALLLSLCMMLTLFAACGESSESTTSESASASESAAASESASASASASTDKTTELEAATVYLYAAASMENAFTEIIENYKEVQPNVTVVGSYDSSGTLQTQIEEADGKGIDIFFSAGEKQVSALNEEGLLVDGSIVNLLGNALCLVTYKDSGTAVTSWTNMNEAKNMALCDGTVPVGQYTRKLLVALDIVPETEDTDAITTEEISNALGGLEISEADNVSVAASDVVEHSDEITTCYYTDYYSYQDDLDIIEMDKDGEYTGPIIYPVCQVNNTEADENELAATADFLDYIQSEAGLQVFSDYCFIIND